MLVHRLSAVFLCLGLVAGNAAVCASWMPTPQARMACCTDDCPMHQGEPDKSPSQHVHVPTPAEADACCAASEREQSNTSSPTTIVTLAAPVLGTGIVLRARVPARVSSVGWRTDAHSLSPPVPRYILLSVFLV